MFETIDKYYKWIMAGIGGLTVIISFIALVRENIQLAVVIVIISLFLVSAIICIQVRTTQKVSVIDPPRKIFAYEKRFRDFALLGLVIIPVIILMLLIPKNNRKFVKEAFIGTPTFTPTFTFTPTETSTVTPTSTQTISPLPSSTEIISIRTETPTHTQSPTVTVTPSPTSTSTSSPSPTITPTFTPTNIFNESCVDSSYWNLSPDDNLKYGMTGCWDLDPWSVFLEAEGIRFLVRDETVNYNLTRGLNTPITSQTNIHFEIKADILTTNPNFDAIVFAGVGNRDSLIDLGRFFIIVVPGGDDQMYFQVSPGINKYFSPRTKYQSGNSIEVDIAVDYSRVSIYVNGKQIYSNNLPADDREVFWIGYSLPGENGNLSAFITDLKVEKMK